MVRGTVWVSWQSLLTRSCPCDLQVFHLQRALALLAHRRQRTSRLRSAAAAAAAAEAEASDESLSLDGDDTDTAYSADAEEMC